MFIVFIMVGWGILLPQMPDPANSSGRGSIQRWTEINKFLLEGMHQLADRQRALGRHGLQALQGQEIILAKGVPRILDGGWVCSGLMDRPSHCFVTHRTSHNQLGRGQRAKLDQQTQGK